MHLRATYPGIRTCPPSTRAYARGFTGGGNAPLPMPLRTCLSFGSRLEPPYIIGARTHRPVSCYALFKWWLLLSQHPGCLRTLTSFHTEPAFRGLSWRSGLFPSRQRSLSPAVSLPSSDVAPFGV